MATPKSIYLIAKYYAKPRNPNRTFKKGYVKDESNMAYDEQISITKGLRDKDLLSSKIVLNISEQLVVRNSFDSDKTFMELFAYFYKESPQYISGALQELGVGIKDKEVTDELQSDVQEGQADSGSEPAAEAEPVRTREEV